MLEEEDDDEEDEVKEFGKKKKEKNNFKLSIHFESIELNFSWKLKLKLKCSWDERVFKWMLTDLMIEASLLLQETIEKSILKLR